MSTLDVEHAAVALRFAEALMSGDFRGAHALLALPLAAELSPSDLEIRYNEMLALYEDVPPVRVEVTGTLEEWSGKQEGDRGWAFVAIDGPNYAEGVAVIVTQESLIRDVEWGGP